jgi:RNA polymerase sigma-70 factor, ECF subfamily
MSLPGYREGFLRERTIVLQRREPSRARGRSVNSTERVQGEEVLRRAVLSGDERAWQTWYQETFDDLYRYVLWRSGGQPDRAQDVVQETWMTAVRHVRRFDPRRASFLSWLRGLAANILRNHLRQQRRLLKRERSAAASAEQSYTDPLPREEAADHERIAATLDALPERQEAVLRAKYLDGLSVAEIAAMSDETPKAVESMLSRARESFRKIYENFGDEKKEVGQEPSLLRRREKGKL